MQFHLPGNKPDPALLASLLRPLDPDAQITLDSKNRVLEVITTANADQVVATLERIGCEAKQLETMVHISGGSTCCGGCG